MIIEIGQKKDSVDISYIDENNQISLEEIMLPDGYYTFVECDDYDPDIIPNKRSFYGKGVKRQSDKYFKHHSINHFLTEELPTKYPEKAKVFNKIGEPNPFSVDIEVLPTQEFGYSPPEMAQNPVTSIAITDKNLDSIVFIVENPDHPEFSDSDMAYINKFIKDSLGEHANDYAYNTKIRSFKTEKEMLEVFADCMNKYFHFSFGWNFITYDWLYIFNRCERIGVKIASASPTRKFTKRRFGKKGKEITVQLPQHRIVADYMQFFKESLIYNNLGSYSLEAISTKILNIGKVSYDGNLRKLYQDDFRKFVAYNFVDTILVMLIHKATNLSTVDFFQSFYTGVPYLRLSQNAISEALVYQELKEDNIMLLETEKTGNQARKYKGGYVKDPLKKIVEAAMGIDYGALYPNSIITTGMSPEKKVDSIKVNDDMYPLNDTELEKWLKYKAQGCCLTPTGRIYDVKETGLYPRIEKKLLKQRKVFKGHMTHIYLNLTDLLELEIEKRKKQITN